MAKSISVQKDRSVCDRGRRSRFILYLIAICRKPLIAYAVIAFAISFGFHELEHHTDRQLAKSLYDTCLQTNRVRAQVNSELIKLNNVRVRLHPLPLNDCSKIPNP